MDKQGVDVQALTINGFWWYAADRDLASRSCRRRTRGSRSGSRRTRIGSSRWPRWRCSIPTSRREQLEDGVKRLGLRGASIGGHVNGEDLSLPNTTRSGPRPPSSACRWSCIPAARTTSSRTARSRGRGDLGNIIGNPLETTYFLSRLIFDGTFDKFPGLRVCGAHAGGYLPSYLGRTEAACVVRDNANCANKKKPSEYLRSADPGGHDGVLRRRPPPPRRRDGRRPGRLRHRRAVQLAGHGGSVSKVPSDADKTAI